mmetsp:Transcript_3911/g.7622  ORF Transcript_3911/g.7622 Transcript_3911/m.7622 type:complete len:213 (+) Transcript_3911:1069-1707(+)
MSVSSSAAAAVRAVVMELAMASTTMQTPMGIPQTTRLFIQRLRKKTRSRRKIEINTGKSWLEAKTRPGRSPNSVPFSKAERKAEAIRTEKQTITAAIRLTPMEAAERIILPTTAIMAKAMKTIKTTTTAMTTKTTRKTTTNPAPKQTSDRNASNSPRNARSPSIPDRNPRHPNRIPPGRPWLETSSKSDADPTTPRTGRRRIARIVCTRFFA